MQVLAGSFQDPQLLVVLLELHLLSEAQEEDIAVRVAPRILLALQERRFDVAELHWTSLDLHLKPERSPNVTADARQADLHRRRAAQLDPGHSEALELEHLLQEGVVCPRWHRLWALVRQQCLWWPE
jgi:hypothetical protein